MKTICIITGTRAEYGLLKGLMNEIKKNEGFKLLNFVTGTHLEEKFGNTYKLIENDGFIIDEKIPMDLKSDTSQGIIESMSKEMYGLGKCFSQYDIDLLVILGDRYEMLVAAQVALINNVDIAHLCGGDVTEGAYDDAIRHSITKMAKYHFVTCESSYNNVISMGEKKENVFLVGNPGLYDIMMFSPLQEEIFYKKLNIQKRKKNVLVVNHSETLLSKEQNQINIDILCDSLINIEDFTKTNVLFIHSNADNNNDYIFEKINQLDATYNNIYAFTSIERDLYLNLIYYCDCFIGNSSCGIYEVPLLKKITFNLGNRQNGRTCGNSVIHIDYDKNNIIHNINNIPKIDTISYPYVIKNSSKEIVNIFNEKI
tara:strand:+ start:944 stop:2053 length:1110 start_codon:yes stop_codon:yes gene_type:complete